MWYRLNAEHMLRFQEAKFSAVPEIVQLLLEYVMHSSAMHSRYRGLHAINELWADTVARLAGSEGVLAADVDRRRLAEICARPCHDQRPQ